MRTKEATQREANELQERAWIYMHHHHQAPPPTRHAAPSLAPLNAQQPSGFIPLAPLASHAPSPLVAARAAAASLALHVNANNSSSATWGHRSQLTPLPSRDHYVRPSTSSNIFGGMVKLERSHSCSSSSSRMSQPPPPPPPSHSAAANHKKPLPLPSNASSFVFRSIISKPPVPEAPTPLAHVQRTPGGGSNNGGVNGLMDLLPKRAREEDYAEEYHHQRRMAGEDEEYEEDDGDISRGGKRACLPKKCDFPMCKNSSRSRGFCYSHGGGRRCRVDNCANGAVSRDLCKRHGGGRRCRIGGCKSSSESGGLCYSHGGGRRCNLGWCNARAKKGGYCAAHVDNRNALPPVDLVENERDEMEAAAEQQQLSMKAPVKIAAAKPKAAVTEAVNSHIIETLLSLSKSPSQSETEDNGNEATSSPTDLMSPRLANPYALASILN